MKHLSIIGANADGIERGTAAVNRGVHRNLLREGCTPRPQLQSLPHTKMKFDGETCICTALQYWYMYTFCAQKKKLVAHTRRTRARGLWIDALAVRIDFCFYFRSEGMARAPAPILTRHCNLFAYQQISSTKNSRVAGRRRSSHKQ